MKMRIDKKKTYLQTEISISQKRVNFNINATFQYFYLGAEGNNKMKYYLNLKIHLYITESFLWKKTLKIVNSKKWALFNSMGDSYSCIAQHLSQLIIYQIKSINGADIHVDLSQEYSS